MMQQMQEMLIPCNRCNLIATVVQIQEMDPEVLIPGKQSNHLRGNIVTHMDTVTIQEGIVRAKNQDIKMK